MSDYREDKVLAEVETEAEYLVGEQLDLLAQLEVQLRLVHRTLSNIEKLRGAKHRYHVGPKFSADDRAIILGRLHRQLEELDGHLETQRQSCRDMHKSVDSMQSRLTALKRSTGQAASEGDGR